MNIHVKLSGYLAASLGAREKNLELLEGATIKDALNALNLPVSQSWIAVSQGGRLKDRTTVLKDGDEILVMPLGGGG